MAKKIFLVFLVAISLLTSGCIPYVLKDDERTVATVRNNTKCTKTWGKSFMHAAGARTYYVITTDNGIFTCKVPLEVGKTYIIKCEYYIDGYPGISSIKETPSN